MFAKNGTKFIAKGNFLLIRGNYYSNGCPPERSRRITKLHKGHTKTRKSLIMTKELSQFIPLFLQPRLPSLFSQTSFHTNPTFEPLLL